MGRMARTDRSGWSRTWIALCFGVLVVVKTATACTIPVFRYALDRWDADPFRLVVSGPVAAERETLKLLAPLRGNGIANVVVEERGAAAAEQASLLFPGDDAAVWKGTIDAAAIETLIDSPARRELIARLLAGDSVVWVVAPQAADAADAERIAARLRFLEQVAELPVQDPDDPDSRLGPGPPLQLKFSVLRCRPDDPAERAFVRMLAGPAHAELVEQGTSFAAAVFGRGRVLGVWPLADLDDRTLEDATLFLTGRCSCRMKDGNPGWDLLLKVDWEHALAAADASADAGDPADPVAAVSGGESNREPPETVSFSARPAPVPGTGFGLSRAQLGGIGLAALVALAGWRLWRAR